MNPRGLIIIVSLAANLGLSWLAWRNWHPPGAVPPATQDERGAAAETVPAVQTNNQYEVVKVADYFDWSRLTSADWKEYRDRLRSVGCPEKTVRSVITSEIEEEFIHRRRALLDEFERRFWEKLASRELDDHELVDKPIRELNEARINLIAEVLGPEPEDTIWAAQRAAAQQQERERACSWLPTEKRQRLLEILKQYDEQSQALAKAPSHRDNNAWTEAEQSRRKQLEEEMVAARKALLTADELEEMQLRDSSAASWAMRPGFEVNEEQWRAGAKAKRDFDAAMAKLENQPDPQVQAQLKDAFNEQLQTALGAEHFAAYQAANDEKLQLTRHIVERFQLPDSLADEVTAIQKQASLAAAQITGAVGSSPEDRAAALAAVREETLRSLRAKLSDEVWITYQRYNGDWIKKLSVLPAE
jgi:Tfp pilus assembly protein PilV